MADKQFKVVGKHIKECWATKNERNGTWDTCWGPIAYGKHGAPIVTTELRYGKNGRAFRYWLRFICNCVGCPAELHVEQDFIIQAVQKANRASTRT